MKKIFLFIAIIISLGVNAQINNKQCKIVYEQSKDITFKSILTNEGITFGELYLDSLVKTFIMADLYNLKMKGVRNIKDGCYDLSIRKKIGVINGITFYYECFEYYKIDNYINVRDVITFIVGNNNYVIILFDGTYTDLLVQKRLDFYKINKTSEILNKYLD